MGLGVRPEATIAREAGLELGQRGGIRVDEQMRTSDPAIYAVGDVVEVKDRITDEWAVIPLAGPANRQGRIAADNIAGIPSRYRSTQGTAILKFFSLAAACTGANEKTLKRVGKPYKSVHLHPGSHAGYFPGAKPVALKLLFDPNDGRVLGAQAVGEDGIDKRIDVVATAIAAGMTIDDLAELELCYAPPFGSAKDPVNLAGMAAQNLRAGLVEGITWPEYQALPVDQRPPLLDVRNNNEVALGMIPGAIHIPLAQLRSRMDEVPHGPVVVYCQSGQRSYNACRILRQHGRQAINLSGAYKTYLSH
jgi:rhodanese-related sulfurtransferase